MKGPCAPGSIVSHGGNPSGGLHAGLRRAGREPRGAEYILLFRGKVDIAAYILGMSIYG